MNEVNARWGPVTTGMGDRLTIRYDTRCYFNVRSKADISQLNLPHGNRQLKKCKNRRRKTKK